jgi:two-component system chemotaxis sensor kinase CheA
MITYRMDDLIKEFLIESNENLDLLDRSLVILEKDPTSKETLAQIFRTIHTIKGTSGFLAFANLEKLAHAGESLLSDLRDAKLVIDPEITTCLLKMGDAIRRIIAHIEKTGQEANEDNADLIAALSALREKTPAPLAKPAVEEAKPSVEASGQRVQTLSDSIIRVDVSLLDRLMNLAGELVLARNQILQSLSEDPAFVAAAQHLNLITTELQASVMKTRMQPIGNVWEKFPRVVRDLSQACGKRVKLEMLGKETELDRTIIEAIKDPLTHLLRNSIDHGIETPAARIEAGKPEEGRLTLRAFHESGKVNIEIVDDGCGINAARVKQKAIEKGLVTVEKAARLSDRETFNLIFLPGFSTAEKITNVSGRGVGMDVVKTNIEKIGGTVDISSIEGQGCSIKIRIPLTLAIIPALMVTSSGKRFAIPQVSLLELVRLEGEQYRKGVETLYGASICRLRGQLLPLCYLNKKLELETYPAGDKTATEDAINIVVLQADSRPFGLVVDEINDTEEIVVKPLGKQLKGIPCFAGATIMGDGRVALILDVLGLAQHANVLSEIGDRAQTDEVKTDSKAVDRRTMLLFDASKNRRMAIPLSVVARLEEIPWASVERSGAQEVVQYRGQILPLIRVSDHISGFGAVTDEQHDPMQVVVYSEQGRSVGLIVGRIEDIVEEVITVRREAASQGVLGSAVIQEKVTDLLDVPAVIRAADPTFYSFIAAERSAA